MSYSNSIAILDARLPSRTGVSSIHNSKASSNPSATSGAKPSSYTSSSSSSSSSSCMSMIDGDEYDEDDYDELYTTDGYGTESSTQSTVDSDILNLLKIKRNIKSDLRNMAFSSSLASANNALSTTETAPTAMDIKYYEMAIRAIDVLLASPNYRVIIAIGGTPGSGKSTLSGKVTDILNKYSQSVKTYKSPFQRRDQYHHHYRHPITPIQQYSNSTDTLTNSDSLFYPSKSMNNTATSTPTISSPTSLQVVNMLGNNGGGNCRHNHDYDEQDDDDDDEFDDMDLSLTMEDFSHKTHERPPHQSNSKPSSSFATTVTMDGYHLTRAQLDQFDDPAEAHKRRGSPWTFDAEGVVNMAKTLASSCISKSQYFDSLSAFPDSSNASGGRDNTDKATQPLFFPSFDHAIKDPTPNGVKVSPDSRIVFLEGLYTLYGAEPWNQIVDYVDDSWMIYVDLQVSTARLAKRHLEAGIVDTLEKGVERVKVNDELNARLILDNHVMPNVMINSISL